jgi:hypothetical protein
LRQRAIVVLGPGRCGTSTLARGLIALGLEFGNRLKPAARKNPRGFFEDLDLLRVNYEAHARLGLRRNGSSVGWLAETAWRAADLVPLEHRARQVIRRRFSAAPLWGCKIGGMMRILPFWERIFTAADQDVAYVLAIRHPASVARSRAKLDPYRAIPEKSDLEFAAQILPYAALMAQRPCAVVDYDQIIADPAGQMQRIARQLYVPVNEQVRTGIARYAAEFVSASFRRSEPAGTTHPLTWRLYQALLSAAQDETDIATILPELTALRAEFQSLSPVLRLVDELEDRLRRRGPTLRAMFLTACSHLPTAATFSGHANRS